MMFIMTPFYKIWKRTLPLKELRMPFKMVQFRVLEFQTRTLLWSVLHDDLSYKNL